MLSVKWLAVLFAGEAKSNDDEASWCKEEEQTSDQTGFPTAPLLPERSVRNDVAGESKRSAKQALERIVKAERFTQIEEAVRTDR